MLGHINPDVKEATVIGAGYAGLISAYRLLQSGFKVTIYESASRAGGLISTLYTDYGMVESAAHSIRSSPEIIKLFNDLRVSYVTAKTKKKFILRDGKLKKNPLTLWEMFTAGSYAYFKKSDGQNLTLAAWGAAHVGPGAVDNAFAPLAHGIYAAEPEELDQKLAFPKMTIPGGQTFVERIFKNPGKKEKSLIIAPEKGMADLISHMEAFVQNHKDGKIVYNHKVETLPDVANVVIATSAEAAGRLIQSPRLENIRYAPMISATIFVQNVNLPDGIGFLCARGEDKKILGILFNSTAFAGRANKDYISLTVMLGGTKQPDIMSKNDTEIKSIIASELSRILKFNGEIDALNINRWERAIPLYSAELRETLDALKNGWCATPGHVLVGNYTGEVSIRGMSQTSLALATQ